MNNRDINSAKQALPYRFVPVKGQSKKIKKVNLNTYKNDLYTGKLYCSLYGVNPLILGNTHETEDENNPKSPTRIKPLLVDGKPVISSYTLKGAISNFLAAYIGDPMTRVEKRGFLFRPNINIATKGKKYVIAAGVITEINEEDGYIEILRIKGLPKFGCNGRNNYCSGNKGNAYYNIKVSKFYLDKENDINFKEGTKKSIELYRKGPKSEFYFFDYPNGIDGEGKLLEKFFKFNTGHTNAKYHDYVMFQVKDVEKAMKEQEYFYIDGEEVNTFLETNRILQENLNNHPYIEKDEIDSFREKINKMKELNIGDVIFFEYNTLNYKKEPYVLTFGKTFYYPWAYSRELTKRRFPKDIGYLENEFKDNKISVLRDMFGYTLTKDDEELLDDENIINDMNLNAKSGKVGFNYALYESGYIERNDKYLPRPGSPKASAYEFYLQQDGQTPLTTYGDPARKDYTAEVRLSGRKFYMKSENADNYFRDEASDYSIIADMVLMGTINNPVKFKFTVNFENLTKEQLELLVFALNLNEKKGFNEDTLYHQIGYGKNYGMGAVKIEIDKGFIIRLDGKEINKETYDKIKGLKDGVKSKRNKIDKNFKEILRIHKTKFHYPKLENTDDATIKWHSKLRSEDFKARRRK